MRCRTGLSMQITDRVDGDVMIVSLVGRLVADKDGFFRAEMASRANRTGKIVLDCENLEFLDSTGLGLVVRFYSDFTSSGKKFVLAHVVNKPKLVLEISRANKIFRIFKTVEEAVADLNK